MAVCKQPYTRGRAQYVQGEGFEVTEEEEKDILDKHEEFHMENVLEVKRRLPYLYGIYKAKRDLRWISGPGNILQKMKTNRRPV